MNNPSLEQRGAAALLQAPLRQRGRVLIAPKYGAILTFTRRPKRCLRI